MEKKWKRKKEENVIGLMDMDVNKKEEKEFLELCSKRLKKGRKVYKNQLSKQNMFKEMVEELVDVSNYALLLYCKLKRIEEKTLKKYKRKRI